MLSELGFSFVEFSSQEFIFLDVAAFSGAWKHQLCLLTVIPLQFRKLGLRDTVDTAIDVCCNFMSMAIMLQACCGNFQGKKSVLLRD